MFDLFGINRSKACLGVFGVEIGVLEVFFGKST